MGWCSVYQAKKSLRFAIPKYSSVLLKFSNDIELLFPPTLPTNFSLISHHISYETYLGIVSSENYTFVKSYPSDYIWCQEPSWLSQDRLY